MISTAQLRGARPMLGWTSGELAKRSHIHRRTTRKLEKGEAKPQRETLARIVAALTAGGVELYDGGVRPRMVDAKPEFMNPNARARQRSGNESVHFGIFRRRNACEGAEH